MISILVDNTPLYIPKETTIVLEQHNYTLGDEGVAGDIVWTFELPAEENAKLLCGGQYMYAAGHKEYDCTVLVDGAPITQGKLYIQSSQDEKKLTCGIVSNAFGIGFGNKAMCDNDYGEDITISSSEAQHRASWIAFLQGTLAEQSVVKFMLFANEKFYQDNEDYGYFKGGLSTLMNSNQDAFYKYVNRLFFDANGNIIQNGSAIKQGVRIFNEANATLQNGYAFAPAIRLNWLMRQVMKNAGLKLSGDWANNKYIQRLFAQSYNAIDGDTFQFGTITHLTLNGSINLYDATITGAQKFFTANDSSECFGWAGTVNFGFRLLLPTGELVHSDSDSTVNLSTKDGTYTFDAARTDEIYALCIRTADAERPNIRMKLGWTDGSGAQVYAYGRMPTIAELCARAGISPTTIRDMEITGNGNCRLWYDNTFLSIIRSSTHSFQFWMDSASMLIQLTSSKSNNIYYTGTNGGYTEGNVTPGWRPPSWSSTDRLFIELVKCSVGSTNEGSRLLGSHIETNNTYTVSPLNDDNEHLLGISSWGDLEAISDYEVQESLELDSTDDPLNIFGTVLRWKEHVADMSNADFISKVCQLFGLNMYTNPLTHEVQLSFFANIGKAKSFDITEFVYKKERLAYEPKEYAVTMGTTLGCNDISEENIIDPVKSRLELQSAMVNKAKHVYVENEKAYRRSSKDDDTSKFDWEQGGGDNRPLEAGCIGEEEEAVNIDVSIPNMRWIDLGKFGKYVCEAEGGGCSKLLDEDYDGKFDFVLQQYRGRRLIRLQNGGSGVSEAYIEDANPTIYNEDGDIAGDYINLSAVGDKSVGEMWLKPLYDFKGDCENYRFTASLPGWAFVKLMTLLQPQGGSSAEQVRWIMVGSQRFLPTKVSYELGCTDHVIATIECAAKRTEF